MQPPFQGFHDEACAGLVRNVSDSKATIHERFLGDLDGGSTRGTCSPPLGAARS
jgi:hypothetical protein